ncbi:hypothetical protein U728_1123 [Clostridium botulinum 202F]|uniref:hypothetical protein n=1 Tax=Clostridium sp. ZBS12 TaxID=2949972 RepID=UPI00054093AD|nr:hypothetical protein [Clostridium sp. ZBS12]AIY79576.1 hypothetical protein U728_1123 [Clostridium botulinum 202F]KAI3344403.1 hypothetical protein CIT17_17445 [Clostridium botulinum]KON13573.1 hypothetical protein ACP50_05775 [Clostridium botulinum]MBY6987112.1 hypothetical protein [Clostridium botulinum]NFH02194.1 hypothetical protein [Clostridium botulinum]
MIKNIIKKLFKKKTIKEVVLMDKISELIQVSMDYKHTKKLDNYISVTYVGWRNALDIWMWDDEKCILNYSIDLDSENVIEELEKMKIKLLKLIKIIKVNKED